MRVCISFLLLCNKNLEEKRFILVQSTTNWPSCFESVMGHHIMAQDMVELNHSLHGKKNEKEPRVPLPSLMAPQLP